MQTGFAFAVLLLAQGHSGDAARVDQLLAERSKDDHAMVCKWVRRENSRIKTRQCRTAREWQEIRDRSQEFMSRRINF